MRKNSFAFSLAFAAMMSSAPVFAAGVPEIDVPAIGEMKVLLNGLRQKTDDLEAQNEEREKQIQEKERQLAAMQSTIDMLRQSSTAPGEFETGGTIPAAEIYAVEDNNPHATRLFGDARVTIEQMIAETAVKYGSDPSLAAIGVSPVEFRCWFQALIKQESRFQIGAKSPKAAFGLTQIIPGTAKDLGIYPAYYSDPTLQLEGGARYLLQQVKRFRSMPLALAAYNAGPGAVMKYDGIPPYKETQNYVVKITGYYNEYAAQISGADQTGTFTLSEIAISESSNIADAAIHYAEHSETILIASLTRLQNIITEIPKSKSVKEAMDLNSYAKAEVARMSAVMTRLVAAKRKAEWAEYGRLFAAYAKDHNYFEGLTK